MSPKGNLTSCEKELQHVGGLEELAQARRLMALRHTLHVPIGLTLFTADLIHIVAAIYYATLLR